MKLPAALARMATLSVFALSLLQTPLLAGKTQDEQPPPASPPSTPGLNPETATAPVTANAADYPSLQAAVDAIPASGGIVRIPPGTYQLAEPLIIRYGDTRIEGAGTATWIKNLNEDGKPAIVIQPEVAEKDARARLWRVEICNLRVTGNRKSGPGIHAKAVQEIVIRNVSVDRHGSHGILMNRCEENPRVIGCNFTYNNGYGLRMEGGHDMVVSANQFEENLHGISVSDAYNLTFTGNNIDDHLQNGVVIENTYGSVVSGNMIEECEGTAVILDRECYGITLSSNVIAHHLKGGIDLRNAWGCTVTGNNFVLLHDFSIRVNETGGRHTITGNHFTNSYIGNGKVRRKLEHKDPFQLDVGAGIVLKGTEDIVVTGNQFSGIPKHAVLADGGCTRLLITSNLITDYGRQLPPGTNPIQLGAATETVVSTNLIGTQSPLKRE